MSHLCVTRKSAVLFTSGLLWMKQNVVLKCVGGDGASKNAGSLVIREGSIRLKVGSWLLWGFLL